MRVMQQLMDQLSEAITFAQAHEIPWPRDPAADPARWGVHHDDPPPFNRLRGPVHPRGGVSGVIRVRGEEVAAWGEPDRADQTFSVAKTYLALLAGIAHSRGLLDPGERVSDRLPGIGFDSEHNRAITWEHLLTQTSEWQGECFGMPDQVEHYRRVSHDPKPPRARKASSSAARAGQLLGIQRRAHQPALAGVAPPLQAAAAAGVPRKRAAADRRRPRFPLGGLRRCVGRDRRPAHAVRSGRHALGRRRDDQRARPGAHRPADAGRRRAPGRQLVPREWVQRMQAPCAVAPFYGWLTWLNRDGRLFADASRASWFMFGAGGHTVWIDPDNEAVVVARWLDGAHSAGFVSRVAQALRSKSPSSLMFIGSRAVMTTVGQKRTADIGHSVIHPLTYSGAGEACLEVASAVPASSRD